MIEIEVNRVTFDFNIYSDISVSIKVDNSLRRKVMQSYFRDDVFYDMQGKDLLVDLKDKGYAYLENFNWDQTRDSGGTLFIEGNVNDVMLVDSKDEFLKANI